MSKLVPNSVSLSTMAKSDEFMERKLKMRTWTHEAGIELPFNIRYIERKGVKTSQVQNLLKKI